MRMMCRVAWFVLAQAYYDLKYACGGTQVLLTDPRWVDPLHLDLGDYEDLF